MQIDFSDKVVVITGAGGGIGGESVKLFAQLGASVIAVDVSPAGLERVTDATEGSVTPIVADVTRVEEIDRFIDTVLEEQGRIDVLFNNAGGSTPTPMERIDRSEFERLRALNFDAVYYACLRVLPLMAEQGRGVILNTTSGAGTGAVDGLAVYGAAKAGVNSLTRSIALEYGRKGVRANAIAPSAASEPMKQWLQTLPGGIQGFADKQPMGRLGKPMEIAQAAAFLASDYASFINGAVIPVDGGLDAMMATTPMAEE